MRAPIRWLILGLALALPLACATLAPPAPPATPEATRAAPARTPTPATSPTSGATLTAAAPTLTPATNPTGGATLTATAPTLTPATNSTSGATLTAAALTPTPAAIATNNTPKAPGLGPATAPRGLAAVNNFEPSTRVGGLFDARTYTNPNVAGLTFRTSWADVEPAEGDFVWTKLDTVFDNAEKNGKWVELVLIPGFGTPAWAVQGVQTATFGVKYGPGKGEDLPLPLPWDQIYLNRWFVFLKAVSARYQNRPAFIKIAAAGPTSVTAEMSLPNEPADLCAWVQVGYTSDRLIGAWQQVLASYAQIFPRQYFSLALYPPLPIVGATRCDNGHLSGTAHSESQRLRAAVVALGADNYPRQFILQANGLTAAKEDPSNAGGYDLVKSYSGRVGIGFQLTTSAIAHPSNMGDPDGVTALQKSLQKGLDANAQFLEVYEPDVLAPDAQKVLAAFASALAVPAR